MLYPLSYGRISSVLPHNIEFSVVGCKMNDTCYDT
jgi:hypothetical protein